jgi:hypothetical protein
METPTTMELADFERWLRGQGLSEFDAHAYVRIAERILPFVGSQAVTPSAIETAHRSLAATGASDKALDNLRTVGDALLRFQTASVPRAPGPTPTPRATLARLRTETRPSITAADSAGGQAHGMGGGSAPSADISAPLPKTVVRCEGCGRLQPAGRTNCIICGRGLWDAAPAAPTRNMRRVWRMAATSVVVLALAIGVGAFAWRQIALWNIERDHPSVAADGSYHVKHIGIGITLPAGWRHLVRDDREISEPLGTLRASLFFRGGSAFDPEQALFLASFPAVGELAHAQSLSDADLIARAERGVTWVVERLPNSMSHWKTASCAVVQIASRRTARCRGNVTVVASEYLREGTVWSAATYLTVEDNNIIFPVLLSRKPDTDATRAEADALVASIRL